MTVLRRLGWCILPCTLPTLPITACIVYTPWYLPSLLRQWCESFSIQPLHTCNLVLKWHEGVSIRYYTSGNLFEFGFGHEAHCSYMLLPMLQPSGIVTCTCYVLLFRSLKHVKHQGCDMYMSIFYSEFCKITFCQTVCQVRVWKLIVNTEQVLVSIILLLNMAVVLCVNVHLPQKHYCSA